MGSQVSVILSPRSQKMRVHRGGRLSSKRVASCHLMNTIADGETEQPQRKVLIGVPPMRTLSSFEADCDGTPLPS